MATIPKRSLDSSQTPNDESKKQKLTPTTVEQLQQSGSDPVVVQVDDMIDDVLDDNFKEQEQMMMEMEQNDLEDKDTKKDVIVANWAEEEEDEEEDNTKTNTLMDLLEDDDDDDYDHDKEYRRVTQDYRKYLEDDDGWDTDHEANTEAFVKRIRNFPEEIRNRMVKYHRMACASKGFEVDNLARPNECWVYCLDLDKDPDQSHLVNRLAELAVSTYNQVVERKGGEKKLKFDRVSYANYAPNPFSNKYFITLVCTEISTGRLRTYQARVSYYIVESDSELCDYDGKEFTEVEIFRPQTLPIPSAAYVSCSSHH